MVDFLVHLNHAYVMTQQDKAQMIALIARGDKNSEIVRHFDEKGVKVHLTQIKRLRTAEKGLVVDLQNKMVERNLSNATKILDKSRNLIEKKLDYYTEAEDKRLSSWQRLQNGEITGQEYLEDTRGLPDVSLAELNSVSRESFSQSQVESGKPTVHQDPAQQQAQLQTLLQAINNGDEVTLTQLVLKKQ